MSHLEVCQNTIYTIPVIQLENESAAEDIESAASSTGVSSESRDFCSAVLPPFMTAVPVSLDAMSAMLKPPLQRNAHNYRSRCTTTATKRTYYRPAVQEKLVGATKYIQKQFFIFGNKHRQHVTVHGDMKRTTKFIIAVNNRPTI